MVAGRPRRSAAPDSYRIAFPELTSSSSGSDESGEEDGAEQQQEGDPALENGALADNDTPGDPQGTTDGTTVKKEKKKKKKRKEPSPSPEEEPDSASGSEFAPDIIKNKDGTVVQVEEEADDDDGDFAEDVVEESESGDSAAGEKDLDNISIANSEGLESGSDAGTGKQGIRFGKTRYFFSGDPGEDGRKTTPSSGPPPMRIVGRGLSATAPVLAGPKKSAVRKKINSHLLGGQKKLGIHELSYGPAFWPPPFVLSKPFNDPAHSPAASPEGRSQGLETLPILSDSERLFYLKRSAYLPFGPVPDICIDLGWYKGKWLRKEDGTLCRAERWGGWYDTVNSATSSFEFVQNITRILPHLPRNVFPAVPTPVHLDSNVDEQAEKAEENEDDAWEQSIAVDDAAAAAETSNAAEVFRSNANHLQGHVQQAQRQRDGASGRPQQEDEGIMRFMLGPITGTEAGETPQTLVEMERFTGVRLDQHLPDKPGFAINAGAPVWGLDWCPQPDDETPADCEYLAVSTVSEQPSLVYRIPHPLSACSSMIQIWSLDTTVPSDFGHATGNAKGRGMRFDLALLTDFEAIQLKWCPRGGSRTTVSPETASGPSRDSPDLERLGILAALSAQGILSLFDIPKPGSARRASSAEADDLVFIQRKMPLLSLQLGNVPISCFDWASHERIIAGCATGHVAIFDIGNALRGEATFVEPSAVFPVHDVDITAIAAIRQPMIMPDGHSDLLAESSRVATTSLDGSCKVVDLRDMASVFDFGHERAVRNAVTYHPTADCLQFVDQEMAHRYLILKGREFGSTARLASQNGPVLDLACSDFHPFFASASAEGSAGISNTIRRLKRGGHSVHHMTRLFRMDFNRNTGTYRMLDNLLPDARSNTDDRSQKGRAKSKKKSDAYPEAISAMPSYSWSPEVAVNRVAWSHSLRRAHVIASGLACGLVRIDMTASHWTAEVSDNTREAGFGGGTGDESD